MTVWLLLFIVLLLVRVGFSWYLDELNASEIRRWKEAPPPELRERVDPENHRRAGQYSLEKLRFGQWEGLFDAFVLLLLLGLGLLAWLYNGFSEVLGYGVWGQALTVVGISLLLSLPSLPFSWWSTFKIEQRYGFNKQTAGLWVTDLVKGAILSILLGVPLAAGLFYLILIFPNTWWLWGAIALFLVQIVMMVLYPMIILPWFNKLSPLEDGELKQRLMDLADRTGFKARTIQVIDGSKRSSHSNAYFTGFGRFRRIVLFDTLIEQMRDSELEAVLAHEIGHYRKGHVPKLLLLSLFSTFILFAVVYLLSQTPGFREAFGFSGEVPAPLAAIVPTFLIVALAGGLVSFWFSPLINRFSRKFEYEADAFAREAVGGAEPMVEALWKLHQENLSNLTPHPRYSAFYYSHPTLRERVQALEGAAS